MPRPARTAAATGSRGETSSTARSSRRRRRASWARGSDCGSRLPEVAALAERVGFIGLGIMGSRMAANLVRAGFPVTVWNRTRERAEAWAEEHRGEVADTPAACAAAADVVVTMVVDGDQVEHVLLGRDGAAEGARAGTLFVDCSTIAPAEARSIGARL